MSGMRYASKGSPLRGSDTGVPLTGRMLEAEQLLARALEHGYLMWVDSGVLKCGPKEKIMPDDVTRIKDHKPELVKLLTGVDSLVAVDHRIRRGAAYLFELEQKGETETARYKSLFHAWLKILAVYEAREGQPHVVAPS